MLTSDENATLTRVGPGTLGGQFMRRYWLPAALSSELAAPDGPPIRVKLLGEKLVAFRDSEGRVGLLNEFCAHRGASLFLGRNEECGLRCVYHGWKYDVEGNCTDMLTEPLGSNFKSKIHIQAYPTLEIGGMIWAYLGPSENVPPPPMFEWAALPESHRFVQKAWEECNWLQSMEGGIDPIHGSMLHSVIDPKSTKGGVRGMRTRPDTRESEVDITDFGLTITNIRKLEDKREWVRVVQYVLPFHTFFPFQLPATEIGLAPGKTDETSDYRPFSNGHIFVPMDDENTMTYNWVASVGEDSLSHADIEAIERSRGRSGGQLERNFRKTQNKDSDWLIDRNIQKVETYTGIEGMHTQDHAVQESMGPIIDRTGEHLGATDKAIIMARKVLLEAVQSVKQGSSEPPGINPSYYTVRSVERVVPEGAGVRWREESDQWHEVPNA